MKVPLLQAILDYLVEIVMFLTPQDPISTKLKRLLLQWRGAKIGRNVKLWRDVWVDDYRKLQIGDDVTIGKSAMLISSGGLTVGNRVMIGHGAQLVSSGHTIPERSSNQTMRFAPIHCATVQIDDDVWIGAGAIVLPGVTVGTGAVVAAGAVVTKSVAPFAVAAGVPATEIKQRG
jgi:acetyltransferase-like isoleucine patch superfamily enzyme